MDGPTTRLLELLRAAKKTLHRVASPLCKKKWHVTHDVTCETWNVTSDTWNFTCYTWNVTSDIWNFTCDMWNVTCGTWREVNILPQFQVQSSYCITVWSKGVFFFFIFLSQLDEVFQILYGFIAISDHISAQNCIELYSDRAKEFTFRRSGLVIIFHLSVKIHDIYISGVWTCSAQCQFSTLLKVSSWNGENPIVWNRDIWLILLTQLWSNSCTVIVQYSGQWGILHYNPHISLDSNLCVRCYSAYSVQCTHTLYFVQCSLYSVQQTVFTLQCTWQ